MASLHSSEPKTFAEQRADDPRAALIDNVRTETWANVPQTDKDAWDAHYSKTNS